MTYRHLLIMFLIAFSVFTWWLSGYDFDTRGVKEATWFFFNTAIVAWLSCMPISYLDERI